MAFGALPELPPALGPPWLAAALALVLAATVCAGPWLAPRTPLHGSVDALLFLLAGAAVVTAGGVAAWRGHAPPEVLTLAIFGVLECGMLMVWCAYGFGRSAGGDGGGGEDAPRGPREPPGDDRFPWWPTFERELNAWAARRRDRPRIPVR